ncbi:MAG: hypothetical protein KF866_09950 [Phycisphaeraceae bacterium]|nr:hypothetical protein [Phycisphaeraceae bacterium]MCW5754822.1 hypothetical protein [Phycisphaeraceae bacterium]
MPRLARCAPIVFSAVFGSVALGAPDPVGIPLDTTTSLVTVEVCIPGGCDSDTSRVSGFLIFQLDDIDAPGQATLREFRLFLMDQIDIDINLGFIGRLRATGNSIDIQHALPLTPVGPVPIENDEFLFEDVPSRTAGLVAYNATGAPCLAFQSAGRPCVSTIDLATLGPTTIEQFSGTLVSANRIIDVESDIDLTIPLDANNPSLGTLRVVGTVRGSAFVPRNCPADFSGSSDPTSPDYGFPDGQVDGSDFFYFLDQFVLGNLLEADLTGSSDPTDPNYGVPDGQIDGSDFFYFLDLFVQGCS